ITVLSLFLLGAGRIDSMNGDDGKLTERQQMLQLVSEMTVQMPEQYREEWQKAAEQNPQLLLSINTEKLAYEHSK
ncbi:MAG: hypothetical protein ACYC4Q_11900, partial [Victivallaceae bacterium]